MHREWERRRQRARLPRHTLPAATIVALVLWSGTVMSSPRSPESAPVDPFVTYVALRHALLYGTVESIQPIVMKPTGACGQGLSQVQGVEYTIAVNDIDHGAMLDSIVTVRSWGKQPNASSTLGAQVLAWGNRLCEDGWRIWGGVAPLNSRGELVAHSAPFASLHGWSKTLGRNPGRRDLEVGLAGIRQSVPDTPFERVRSLHVVAITGSEGNPNEGREVFTGTIAASLLGGYESRSIELHFQVPDGAQCPSIGTGDTLLVPGSSALLARRVVLHSCGDYGQVVHGFIPGLGVSLENAQSAFSQATDDPGVKLLRRTRNGRDRTAAGRRETP